METPTIFFCRNNGYAISTPTSQQYRGDGIAVRGPGYGINTIRVDGNDLFAVYNAVQKAREMIMDDPKPVLIEAMTYRGGHHSTSDDSTRYRSIDEIKVWQEQDNPLTRLRIYLEDKNFWDADKERDMNKRNRKEVMTAMQTAESRPKPGFDELFSDVFDEVPQHLLEQKAELIAHVQKHKDAYPDMS
jgi:2-oxoisovalerate dehydrogenase E1 component alpha subunit